MRPGDLNLGKVALYQLSYIRAGAKSNTAPFEQPTRRSIRILPIRVWIRVVHRPG